MPEYRELDAVLAAVPAKYAPVIRALLSLLRINPNIRACFQKLLPHVRC